MDRDRSVTETLKLRALGIPVDGEALERIRIASLGLTTHTVDSASEAFISDSEFGGTFLLINIAIVNDAASFIQIDQFRIDLPWLDPNFKLLGDPYKKSPREKLYSSQKAPTLEFERDEILNHRIGRQGRIAPGESIDGYLFGEGDRSLPGQYRDNELIGLPLAIIDRRGRAHRATMPAWIHRSLRVNQNRQNRMGTDKAPEKMAEKVVTV